MGLNGISSMLSSAIDKVALNPQPLPPKYRMGSLFDKVALNPQPLPPKTARFLDDFCGTKPPKPGPWPPVDLGAFLKSIR